MKKCFKYKKEIVSGKYYYFYSGKLGGKLLARAFDSSFFCPFCADKEQKIHFLGDNLIKIEWEIGNKTDEEILGFEEKWKSCKFFEEIRKTNPNINLTSLQQERQIFETYLQQDNIVEKSFGGKVKGYGKPAISVYYLFDKSARKGNYCQEVVEKVIAEILGVEKINQRINTTTTGSAPGITGYTGGEIKVNNDLIRYQWIDGSENICRRIALEIREPKFAVQSLVRALKIKEREITRENTSKNSLGSKLPLYLFVIEGTIIIAFCATYLFLRKKKNK